jgi:hypothetical protein
MYFTHHFAHHETLSRVHSWLAQLGFKPHQIEMHKDGIPRIALSIEPYQWAEVSLLIAAVERTDPDGFPSFWDPPRSHRIPSGEHPEATPVAPHRSRSAAIGWHPLD